MILPDVNILVYAYRGDAVDHLLYKQWLEGIIGLGIYLKSVKDFLIPWALMFAIVILGIPTGEALLAVVPFVWAAYGYYRVKTSNENLGG